MNRIAHGQNVKIKRSRMLHKVAFYAAASLKFVFLVNKLYHSCRYKLFQ